jgi:hypothetical protein
MSKETLRWILLGDVLLLIPSYIVSLYVQWKIVPEVEAQLKTCKIIDYSKIYFKNRGIWGRSHRYVMVNLALTSTRMLAKKGWVDLDEVNGISRADRRWICIPMQIGTLSVCVLLVLYGLDKFC